MIPVTVMVTFIALKLMGQTFNLMTLGGLAAAVGLVIDDAIVVVENIVLHRDLGQSRLEAIRSALKEITIPLLGSTITPIVVFIPLIVITGVYGVFFRALAVTMTVSLATSLALALTWTPTLSQYFIRGKHEKEHTNGAVSESDSRVGMPNAAEIDAHKLLAAEEKHLSGFFLRVIQFHERWLRRALERPLLLLLFSAGADRGLRGLFHAHRYRSPARDGRRRIRSRLLDAGRQFAHGNQSHHLSPGANAEAKFRKSRARRAAPACELGLAAVTEANRGDILAKLKRKRDRGIEDIIADIRAHITREEPAVRVEFVQVLQDMIGDLTSAPEPVQIKLFSQDPKQLDEWAPKVADAIAKVEGVVDVLNGIENTISGPAVTFQVDPSVAARAGFTAEEVALDASAILEGEPAPTPVITNDRAYIIRVRFPAQNRASLQAMRDTLLVSSTGHTATLGSLASIIETPGQTEIRRENLQRDVAITARLEGRGLGSGMADVQKVVAGLHIPVQHSRGIWRPIPGTTPEFSRSLDRLSAGRTIAVHRAAV